MPVARPLRLVATVSLALLATAAGATAQPAAARGWEVRRDAFAELWYHGLALVGTPRYGPLPLQDDGYAAAHGAAARGALRDAAPALRAAFARDSAFDVLHFVPLWFVGEPPDAVLAALRGALAPSPVVAGRLGGRASAVAAVLDSPERRAVARAFVAALAEEQASLPPDATLGGAALAALRRRWELAFHPALAPYLARLGRADGVIVPVPAVGAEGRIARFAGGATIVIVGTGAAGDDALLAAVRELAFPLLDGLAAPGGADRRALERAREVAAVRAGALLLDALLPEAADAYRRRFAAVAGRGATPAFDLAFPASDPSERALRAAVARLAAQPRPR